MNLVATKPFRGWHVILLPLACFWIGLSVGCEWMDQDDMRRYAIQRAPDDEDEDEEPAQNAPRPEQTSEKRLTPSAAKVTTEPAAEEPSAVVAAPDSAKKPARRQNRPKEPLSPAERAARSSENLERIVQALVAYREDKGRFPPFAIRDRDGNPLLSWRVELLPYIGHEKLYRQFDLDQPWYTPKNKSLLDQIPAVYQSPERFDEKTCYRLPIGKSTIFQKRTLLPQRVEDGLANTVFLLETDKAVAWTEPDEHKVDPRQPAAGIGETRDGVVFLAWANGVVGSVSTDASAADLTAMFTPDTGEPFSMASVNRPIDPGQFGEHPPAATSVSSRDGQASIGGAAPKFEPRRVGVEADRLATAYERAAALCLTRGDYERGWRWLYGSIALKGADPEAFGWFPALRRPAIGVHFGIALVDASSETEALMVPVKSRIKRELASRTAPFGEAFLNAFERVSESTTPVHPLGASPTDSVSHRAREQTANDLRASCFAGNSPSGVIRLAKTTGCDVLLVMSVDRSPSRRLSSAVKVRLAIRVLDLVRDRNLMKPARMEATSDDHPEAWQQNGSYQETLWAWRDLLDEGFIAGEWPLPPTEKIASQRLKALGKARNRFPLRAIAEMSYYQAHGLVDQSELLMALQELLGERPAMDLLLGDTKKKERVLRRWLPQQDAEAFVEKSSRPRTRLVSADDDD